MFRKTENGALDNLLRAHLARASGPPPLCREFDPDFATAYIEHSLTARERAQYEQHLSLCASCRKGVVALARMAEVETVFAKSGVKSHRVIRGSEPRWKTVFGAISGPQWAMAAAAVIILAISVPLFISRKDVGVNQQPLQSKPGERSSSNDAPADLMAKQENPAGQIVEGGSTQAMPARQAANAQQDRTAPKPAGLAEDSGESPGEPSGEKATGVVAGAVARSEPPRTQPVEDKTLDQSRDEIASKEISRGEVPAPAPSPAPEQAPPENQLAKISPEEARRVPEQSKDKADVTVLQPARPDGDQRAKREGVVKSGDITPPPPPASGARGRNAMTAAPGGLNSRLTDSTRHKSGASERKIGGKKFWLKDGTWIDKDYNPDKDLPVVTFVRDSDVYKEHLAKRQGMKSYLTGFAENERVIFIYKGTVYIIVPQ